MNSYDFVIRAIEQTTLWRMCTVPAIAFFIHYLMYIILVRVWRIPSPLVDKTACAGISMGITFASVYQFWNVLPMGKITPALLELSNAYTVEYLTSLWFLMLLAMMIYHCAICAWSETGNLSYLVRKLIPLCMLYCASSSTKPLLVSEMIAVVAWTIRYSIVDVIMDIAAVRTWFVVHISPASTTLATILVVMIKILAISAWSWIFFESVVSLRPLFDSPVLFVPFMFIMLYELNPIHA